MTRKREIYITLEEVIPHARVVSLEEGIIEYHNIYFILGTHDLYRRKQLLDIVSVQEIVGPCIVDMRFNTQVILKKGPVLERLKPGPEKLQ